MLVGRGPVHRARLPAPAQAKRPGPTVLPRKPTWRAGDYHLARDLEISDPVGMRQHQPEIIDKKGDKRTESPTRNQYLANDKTPRFTAPGGLQS